MKSSVRTKAQEKQPAFASTAAGSVETRKLQQAVLALEDAVYHVLDINKGHAFHDVDFLYWNRRLKNIAMQVSMAMVEYGGIRHFHHHYRHEQGKSDALYPVAGPSPLITLARVCREALTECADLTGVTDKLVLAARERLEQSLRMFLHRYRSWQEELETASS